MATTFDGYPMAQQGRAAQALTAAFTSSFVGALFAVLLITFLAPLLAKFALKFGPAEFFAVQLLTFCSFVGMSKEPAAKTIASMMLGFALAAVGLDSVTGHGPQGPRVFRPLYAGRHGADAEVRDKLLAQGAEAVGGTPERLGQTVASEIPKWIKLAKDANIRAD
mgnify:CR=1 FL=1